MTEENMSSKSQSDAPDLGKRRYWGLSGFVGIIAGAMASYFFKSDVLVIAGIVAGLLGGFVVAAIRGSGEI